MTIETIIRNGDELYTPDGRFVGIRLADGTNQWIPSVEVDPVTGGISVSGPSGVPLFSNIPPVADTKVIGHRGGESVECENSLEAFQSSYQAGIRHFECDVQLTSNGTGIIMHDATVDRTTDGTGTISAMTTAAVLATNFDLMAANATGYEPKHPQTLADVFKWAVNKDATLWIEGKSSDAVDVIVSEAQRHQFDSKRLIIQAATQSWLTSASSAGFGALMIYFGSLASVNFSTLAAAGVTHVGGDTWLQSEVNACKAAGITPVAFTVRYRYQATAFRALGIEYIMCSDPVYISGHKKKTFDTFLGGRWSPGIVSGDDSLPLTNRGTMGATGLIWSGSTAVAYVGSWMGAFCPIDKTSYTISFRASIDNAASNRWIGVFICASTDGKMTDNATREKDGYHVLFRQGGTLDIYKSPAGGTATQIGTQTGSAFTLGTLYDFTVTVTPTSISASANGTTVSANDSSYRGGYFMLGRNFADATFKKLQVS